MKNDFLYNGKELQDELDLGWYDYGARMQDPTLGRFFTQDRFAEKYLSFSPYQYGANNPILYIDVNGDSLSISGDGASQLLGLYNEGLEGHYEAKAGENGLVTLQKTDKEGEVSSSAQAYFDQLSSVTSLDAANVSIKTVTDSKDVPLADPINGVIDVGDISAIAKGASGELGNLGANIALHETAEQTVIQSGGEMYSGHQVAITTENAVNPNVQRTKGTDVVKSFSTGIFTQLNYSANGSRKLLQVTFKENNVSDVKVIK